MPKIKDIISQFKNTFGLNGLHAKPVEYMDYEDVTNKVEEFLQSSLTSLLDSIEKELPEPLHINDSSDFEQEVSNYAQIKYRQEVINIINSHKV